jgi:hypothetical protein
MAGRDRDDRRLSRRKDGLFAGMDLHRNQQGERTMRTHRKKVSRRRHVPQASALQKRKTFLKELILREQAKRQLAEL